MAALGHQGPNLGTCMNCIKSGGAHDARRRSDSDERHAGRREGVSCICLAASAVTGVATADPECLLGVAPALSLSIRGCSVPHILLYGV